MNRNFIYTSLLFELLLSSTALGALFISPVDIGVKAFLVASLILISGTFDIQSVQTSTQVTLQARISEIQFGILEAKIDKRETPSLDEAYEQFNNAAKFEDLVFGQGSSFALLLVAKYVALAGAGWAMGKYVLPTLLYAHT